MGYRRGGSTQQHRKRDISETRDSLEVECVKTKRAESRLSCHMDYGTIVLLGIF